MRNIKLIKLDYFAWILILIGLIGLGISLSLYYASPKPPQISKNIKSINVDPAPSSIKPSKSQIASYNVAPSLPKYIAIPAININQARVIELGLLKNGQIATPNNIYDTGWYTGSSKPGDAGAMFIYGHVSSWTANGVFYNLKNLKYGDNIIITRGDNKIYTYKVMSTKIYPYNNVDMNAVLSPIDPNAPGLNLMTCTGKVIAGTSEFNERLVVFTKFIS